MIENANIHDIKVRDHDDLDDESSGSEIGGDRDDDEANEAK